MSIFSNKSAVLPVIHVETLEQAKRNVDIARESGADGCFLINHSISVSKLLEIHTKVVDDWWVGVNCLGLYPDEVFRRIPETVSAVWADNALIDETSAEHLDAERTLASRQRSAAPNCLYFGGIDFKYQRKVVGEENLENACRIAQQYMDVVTTSGPATGLPVLLKKIVTMRRAVENRPLAVASGVTVENIDAYLPYVDCFLVATGISRSFTELDPARTKALVERAHAAN